MEQGDLIYIRNYEGFEIFSLLMLDVHASTSNSDIIVVNITFQDQPYQIGSDGTGLILNSNQIQTILTINDTRMDFGFSPIGPDGTPGLGGPGADSAGN